MPGPSTRRELLGRPNADAAPPPVLVCVFLRGAADALNLVVPYADDRYYELRPTLAVPRPDDAGSEPGERSLRLDDRFALHPELAPLMPAWRSGQLAIVHAVGSDDQTRSHFEAQDRMEHAGAKGRPESSGWLARHLRSAGGIRHGLECVALGKRLPEAVRGAPAASVLESIEEYRLGRKDDTDFRRALAALYADADDLVARAGSSALTTLARLGGLEQRKSGTGYPDHPFGRSLAEIARLVHSGVPMRAATADLDGWDTHFVQGRVFPDLVRTLAAGLAAFREDLGDATARVTTVVMTEFGRRAYENGSFGTDHGRGGLMMLMGGAVRGGQVVCDWPGLEPGALEPPGDLVVTIDYRDVLAEVIDRGLGNRRVAEVFPGWQPAYRGLVRS